RVRDRGGGGGPRGAAAVVAVTRTPGGRPRRGKGILTRTARLSAGRSHAGEPRAPGVHDHPPTPHAVPTDDLGALVEPPACGRAQGRSTSG
ncbi:hypothetical protein DF186_15800, partial [Enterococcus hirae]